MADIAEKYRDRVDPEHELAMTAISFARGILAAHQEKLEEFLRAEQHMHNVGGLLDPTLYRDMLNSENFARQVRLAKSALAFLKEADAVMAEVMAEAGRKSPATCIDAGGPSP